MADWENDIPIPAIVKPIRKWDDEDVDEEDIKPNWDESSDEEKEKPAAPKKTPAQKLADAKRNNNKEEDELERKKRERQAVIDADLENTRGMFQGVSIKETGGSGISSKNLNNTKRMPTKEIKNYTLDSINPKSKDDFDEFSKLLVDRIRKHEKQGMYVNFINDFIRDLCLPLRDADVRKVASTLTNMASDKQKEKDKDKPKKKGKAKPALQVERMDSVDITNYDEFDDFKEFDDDDFM